MTLLQNSAEGQADGVTVTTLNSGVASGDAWDVVAGTTSGGSVQGASTNAIHGTMSIRFASTGATTQTPLVGWNDTGATVAVARWYEYYIAFPNAASSQMGVNLRGNAGATSMARRTTNTDGTFNAVMGSTTGSASGVALSLSTIYRFEVVCTGFNGASGAMTLNCYVGQSGSVHSSSTLTGATTAFTCDNVRFGKFSGAFDVDFLADSFAADIGSSTLLGPVDLGTPNPHLVMAPTLAAMQASVW